MFGFERVANGDAAPDGQYSGFLAIEDFTVTSITYASGYRGPDIAGDVIPAGTYIAAKFTALTTTSGVAYAYYATIKPLSPTGI